MAINASKIPGGNSNFKRPPALDSGAYPARLVQIIDMGLQEQRAFKGEPKPPRNEIYCTYEILDEFLKDEDGNDIEDKPRWVSETITLHSLDSDLATSTKRYDVLDPKRIHNGDWGKLLGQPCFVTLTATPDKNGKKDDEGKLIVYNNIASIGPMRAKDAEKAESLKNPTKLFDGEAPDLNVYLSLPNFLRDKIKKALDYGGSALSALLEEVNEDEAVNDLKNGDKSEGKSKGKTKPKEEPKESAEEEDEDW